MENEKKEWKDKAAKGVYSTISTPESKKKAVRELIAITQENVSSELIHVCWWGQHYNSCCHSYMSHSSTCAA